MANGGDSLLGYPASLPENVSQPQPSVSPTGVPLAQASDPAYQLGSGISPSDQAVKTLPSPGTSSSPMSPDMTSGPMPGVLSSGDYTQPANRGGVVKNILTRMFYGMGQAGLAHAGLPTDYDMQRTQFNQAIQANELALKQQQQAWQQTLVPVTNPWTGITSMVRPEVAKSLETAYAQGQGRVQQEYARPKTLNQFMGSRINDVYNSGGDIGSDPVVQALSNAMVQARPNEMNQFVANWLQKNGLPNTPDNWVQGHNAWVLSKRPDVFSKQTDPTGLVTQTVRTYGEPGAAPTATQSPTGPLTQAESNRLKQFGITAAPGTMPIATAPSNAAPTNGGLPPIPQAVQSPLLPGPPTAAPAPSAAPTTGGAGVTSAADKALLSRYQGTAIYDMANQLVEQQLSPSEAKARGAQYAVALQVANAISRQQTGKPFDPAASDIAYNYAHQPATQNTLKYLNSLTGPDNKSGNLQTLVNLSKSPDLGLTQFPPLNDLQAWAKIRTGNPTQAAYAATTLEVADQVGKILQGGMQGTSDKKLNEAQSLFQKGFTPEQMNAVATSLRSLLANRKTELIGDNRYLQRQFGQSAGAPAAAWGAQFGVKPKTTP